MATAQQTEKLARMIYEKGAEFAPKYGLDPAEITWDDLPAPIWGVAMETSAYILDHFGEVLFGSN